MPLLIPTPEYGQIERYETLTPEKQRLLLLWGLENTGDSGFQSVLKQAMIEVWVEQSKRDVTFDLKHHVHVLDMNSKLVPYVPLKVQEILDKKWAEAQEKRKPLRLIIPKARQEGVTVNTAIHFLRDCTRYNNRVARIVCHSVASNKTVTTKYRQLYEADRFPAKPKRDKDNNLELAFLETGSRIRISTASSAEEGRGDTIHLLHCSEVAFWEPRTAAKTLTALRNAVPQPQAAWNTAIILESTGNGPHGAFYDECIRARDGDSEYEVLFFPWFYHRVYSRPFDSEQQRAEFKRKFYAMSKEGGTGNPVHSPEHETMVRHNLSLEQMYWYETILAEQAGKDPDERYLARCREYPSEFDDCFRMTKTGGAFNLRYLARARDAIREPVFMGDIWPKVDGTAALKTDRLPTGITPEPILSEDRAENAVLKVWDEPQEHHEYTIGVDCSAGQSIKGDPTVALVRDRHTGCVVASYRCFMTSPVFTGKLRLLARYYNYAWINPEANSYGMAIIDGLRASDCQNRLYVRQEVDKFNVITNKFGYYTDRKSKGVLIHSVRAELERAPESIVSIDIINEMAIFEERAVDAQGRQRSESQFSAPSGKHDDFVVAYALALIADERLPVALPLPSVNVKKFAPGSSVPKWNLSDTAQESKMRHEQLGTEF